MKNHILLPLLFLITIFFSFPLWAQPSIEWQKSLGGSSQDYAYGITPSADGGIVVVGETYSNNGDVSGNHGDFDFWIVKLDSLGSLEWQKCLGGGGVDKATSVQQTIDGGFIISGETNSNDGDVIGNQSTALEIFNGKNVSEAVIMMVLLASNKQRMADLSLLVILILMMVMFQGTMAIAITGF